MLVLDEMPKMPAWDCGWLMLILEDDMGGLGGLDF